MRDFIFISKCVVYVARNKINGKIYIGTTEKGIPARRRTHFWNARSGRPGKFNTAIRKYGEDAFEFAPLMACASFFDALEHERRFIKELKPEYNLTDGGGGVKGLKFSSESKEKMAAAKRGKPNHWSNGAMPQHLRDMLSAKAKAQAGRPRTDAQKKANARLVQLGNARRRKGVICTTDGTAYKSLTEAAAAYGLTTGQISYYCKGDHESRRGLDFRYVGDTKECHLAARSTFPYQTDGSSFPPTNE